MNTSTQWQTRSVARSNRMATLFVYLSDVAHGGQRGSADSGVNFLTPLSIFLTPSLPFDSNRKICRSPTVFAIVLTPLDPVLMRTPGGQTVWTQTDNVSEYGADARARAAALFPAGGWEAGLVRRT